MQWNRFNVSCACRATSLPHRFYPLKTFSILFQLFYYSEVRTRQREVSFHQRVEFNAETFILLRDAIFCLPSNRKMFINLIKRKSHYTKFETTIRPIKCVQFFRQFRKKREMSFSLSIAIDRSNICHCSLSNQRWCIDNA